MTERWACRLVLQPRGTQRYQPTRREDEDRLTQAIVALAKQYGRYGYPTPTTKTCRWGPRIAGSPRCSSTPVGELVSIESNESPPRGRRPVSFPTNQDLVRGDPCLWGPRGLTFPPSAGRVLSQLSQYDCAASWVNSPQGAARGHRVVRRHSVCVTPHIEKN